MKKKVYQVKKLTTVKDAKPSLYAVCEGDGKWIACFTNRSDAEQYVLQKQEDQKTGAIA